MERLDLFGLDRLAERVEAGESQYSICQSVGVSPSTMSRWIAATPERTLRMRDARQLSAEGWMDKGEVALLAAGDTVGVARARELAQHYRRMAAIRNPKYSERLQVDAEVGLRTLSDEELDERIGRFLTPVTRNPS